MKEISYDTFFNTLANENRLAIIYYLAKKGPSNVSQIVKGTRLEQSSVSHNLKKLLNCEFIHIKPSGKERVYKLNAKTIKPLLKLIDKHAKTYCEKNCQECKC